MSKKGLVQSYGAVLQTNPNVELGESEGSRTKAAISASEIGTSIKISSDGDIAIYSAKKKFLSI